ncbi:hypothetical protein [Chryseobacterium lathyri]|uniref:Uncharacterized protein n=1 Tax=Chryseobacterium lathyri TaxID=395933 RepID=A0ABT9SS60_9FLAO|nr:hypothetical protein [Chryseobacterium lathyri]MDP9962285.1 hypothetical protein [Chryseobacterium lathyri]MDQ0067172.1 hypothetical protein [Chryseobacterium lathyri]
MKYTNLYPKLMTLSLLISLFNFTHAQNVAKAEIVDKNPIYSFDGVGYDGEGVKKKMILSDMSMGNINTEEISLKDNEVVIGKEGVYKISLTSVAEDNKTKDRYIVNINDKEIFELKSQNLLSTGKYFFQIQLNKGDTLSFSIIKSNEKTNSPIESTHLEIQFTDPKLITYPEHH